MKQEEEQDWNQWQKVPRLALQVKWDGTLVHWNEMEEHITCVIIIKLGANIPRKTVTPRTRLLKVLQTWLKMTHRR
jgi:hypothetical protein